MLRKMRWRFIFSAMTAIFVVMAIVVVCINFFNYHVMAERQDATLAAILEADMHMLSPFEDEEIPPSGFGGNPSLEAQYMTRYFSVHCDKNGEIINVFTDFIASVSPQDARSYAQKALAKGKSSGYYEDYRYLIEYASDETILIFLNVANELQFMRGLLLVSCIVALVSLLAVFGLVVLFSRRAVDPYVKNMERQRQFITDAGHEIKTPLTSISTSADVLAMEDGENEWVKNIRNQTKRLSKLVANLVVLSRLDEERPLPEKSFFSLSDAIWETMEPFVALAKAKGKSFMPCIEEELSMCGDKASIQQMVSILLDNAIRYSDENGRIRLEVFRKRRNIVIEVFNTCSIEDVSHIDRLFDRFFRLDKSRSSDTGGTGIGLSIAQAIAEAHEGQISVKSSDGNTILFRVIL